ncbi:uncharacterized protein LOC109541474 isoform X2 [Dendroctonus ponderosae]|uniref:uncharacterized protein LOC109541474 isoform X2 n=1 Tax=Dendroctonus ponderosae TaxID=77166 RepID=UPI002035E24A|nr:uncharacterized protein LOC109541474 isoform X2 [Dendroctonus ponderosae]
MLPRLLQQMVVSYISQLDQFIYMQVRVSKYKSIFSKIGNEMAIICVLRLIGLWTKRGAVYFVAISFWICTVMIQHFADLLMGIIYLLSYGHGLDGVERFLRRNFENLKESNIFATAKINRIQKCKQCCGINGIDDDYVRLSNDTLISGCCPPDTILPCTRERAYKDGCALKLLEDEYNIGIFHALSAVSIIFQFYNYRASLSAFV